MGYRSFSTGPRVNPTQVPTVPVTLDPTHPLTKGLRGFFLLTSPRPANLVGIPSAIISGGVSVVSGLRGPASSFDGSTSFVDTQTASILDASQAVSMVVRYRPTATGNFPGLLTKAVAWDGASANYAIDFTSTTLVPRLLIAGAAELDGISTAPVNAWSHTIGTNSASGSALYFNGLLDVAGAAKPAPSASALPWRIGAYIDSGGGGFFPGLIEEVKIYNRAVSASEAAWLCAEPYAMLRPLVRRQFFVGSAPSGALTSTAGATSAATGALSGSGALSGTSAVTSTASGTLRGAGAISGTSTAATAAATSLGGTAAGTASAAASSASIATPTGRGALTTGSAATTTSTATLTGASSGNLAGASVAAVLSTGTLTGFGPLSGTSTAASTASGNLTAGGTFPPFVPDPRRSLTSDPSSRSITSAAASRTIRS